MKLGVNGSVREVTEDPDQTALSFLRREGMVGTKEGCASGDCGACTILVGREISGNISYQTRNACITPLNQLVHSHVVTVEGLADSSGLHPAQEAMLEKHASQCGFCTPGFVVSIAALVEAGEEPKRETVIEGISGNLCRCTGYAPIVSAGLCALKKKHSSSLKEKNLFARLKSDDAPKSQYATPLSETELQAEMRGSPDARLIAGGSDLMLEVTQGFRSIPYFIDLSMVRELRAINETDNQIQIGSSVTYSELEHYFEVRSKPFLSILKRLGSRQIRNVGTIGGNLGNGSPIADVPPILLAWDATLELVDAHGNRRSVHVCEFYKGYKETLLQDSEYIAKVRIPIKSMNDFHRFYKVSKRLEDDISSVMGAFRFESRGDEISLARVAFGGMAATPVRAMEIEKNLIGQRITNDLIRKVESQILEELEPISDVRASSRYRLEIAQAMLRRSLQEFSGQERLVITEL